MSFDAKPHTLNRNTRLAKSPAETIEELRDQNHELLVRLGKCECEQTLAEPPPSQPFDEWEVAWA